MRLICGVKKQNKALEQYAHINTWDVSKITDSLFENKRGFNSDISNWNVSNVKKIIAYLIIVI